jgi:hypothetical protein
MPPIPAMVDYPNHLARMYILSQSTGPDANPYYQAAWAPYPNLAMDLIVPQWARLVSVEDATRLFLFFSQILIVGGAVALEHVVKGRIQFAGFVAVMFLYCLPFAWGFLNFEFGMGLMLWFAALYLIVIERSWVVRLLANASFVTMLFTAHFFSLGVYGATLAICELKRSSKRDLSRRDTMLRLVVLAVPVPILFVLMTMSGGSIRSEGTVWGFAYKPLWPFRIMNGYSLAVASTTALTLIVFLYFAAKRGVIKSTSTGRLLSVAFLVLYLVVPSRVFGTSFADLRIIPAAALILPAFYFVSLPCRRWMFAACMVFVGVTLANLSVVYAVWLSYRTDYAAMLQSFEKIKRGSSILSASSGENEDPPFTDLTRYPMYYGPALAVHDANAFVPNLYTEVGKQPIQVHPALRRLAMPTAGLVPLRVLTAVASRERPFDVPDAIANWSRDFEYLYVLGPHEPNPLPHLLEELDRSGRFVLYKIRHTP